MDIRKATPADVQAILEVVLTAMTPERQWQYCFPSRNQHADDHSTHTQAALERCLNPIDDDWLVAVVEVPARLNPRTKIIASVAILETQRVDSTKEDSAGETPQRGSWSEIVAHGHETRKDAKPSRLSAFVEAVIHGRKSYLDGYGHQMYLHLLATHPDYQSRGHAKGLCQWILGMARENGSVVSTLASPTGYIFYSGLGFTDVGCVVVKVEEEWEEVVLKAMAHVPRKERRPSLFKFWKATEG